MSPVSFSSHFLLIVDWCVMRSPRADHPFHVSQLFIILNRTELLLDVFATGLEDGTYSRSSVE
jgi:nuclear pore complex protein Nup107